MKMCQNQSWGELSRPARWRPAVQPAMEALEKQLPSLLGGHIWLHRNVSWSDLNRIGDASAHPQAGRGWPLQYLVCDYRKALFAIRLVAPNPNQRLKLAFTTFESRMQGIPCFNYRFDPKKPEDIQKIMENVQKEVRNALRNPKAWQCATSPVHAGWETDRLARLGFCEAAGGGWIPTQRGEDAGLITLFRKGKDGAAQPELRWSAPTRQALLGSLEPGPIPLNVREARLGRELASSDYFAAQAVRQLAEMPLEDYFRDCPEVQQADLEKLQKTLGLGRGCLFRTAAAALYRRLKSVRDAREENRVLLLAGLLAMPASRLEQKDKNTVIQKFREGRFPECQN